MPAEEGEIVDDAAPEDETKAETAAVDDTKKAAEEPALEPKRKRKSRWGAPEPEGEKRKSRWGNKKATPAAAPSQLDLITQHLTPDQKEMYIVRCKLAQLAQKLVTCETDPKMLEELSPSPEPTYDANGMRTNTKPARLKAKLMKERADLFQQAVKLNPAFAAANGISLKRTKKLMIPQAKHPDYNFIGLIIGPRGNTQKRMEKETGAKISIRGRGAHKNGKSVRRDGNQPGDDEPLHVMIVADSDDAVEAASKLVEELLKPVSEDANAHKAKQLRELAQINGTMIANVTCHSCGQQGHRLYDCPNREKSWKPASITCSICGSNTHPATDCPRKNGGGQQVDSEYSKFMQELTGEKVDEPPSAAAPSASSSAPSAAPAQSRAAVNPPGAPATPPAFPQGGGYPQSGGMYGMYPGYGMPPAAPYGYGMPGQGYGIMPPAPFGYGVPGQGQPWGQGGPPPNSGAGT